MLFELSMHGLIVVTTLPLGTLHVIIPTPQADNGPVPVRLRLLGRVLLSSGD